MQDTNSTSDKYIGAIDKIKEETDKAKNFFVIHRKLFYLILFLVAVAAGICIWRVYKSIDFQNTKIDGYTVKMAQRDAEVKKRDAQIIQLTAANKVNDEAIAKARDSISKAYTIIQVLTNLQKQQNEKHKKDSIAISHLSLPDKIKFITGGNR